jgi:hypothetical protein
VHLASTCQLHIYHIAEEHGHSNSMLALGHYGVATTCFVIVTTCIVQHATTWPTMACSAAVLCVLLCLQPAFWRGLVQPRAA